MISSWFYGVISHSATFVGLRTERRHFLNEVATIGRIHHVHVIRLLGFCLEQHHRILVYEYVNNGSLDNWLFKNKDDSKQLLNRTQRYDIAVGIAKGLGYLHEECRHRIVHCDIKPQNILLDEHLCPKIADFGLAKLMARDESPVATVARLHGHQNFGWEERPRIVQNSMCTATA
ncbi:hypothetical protein L7F22_012325 [Adiantum nelumboides]|nr:hypothetical protein [Adiantum nelumboides]